MVLEQEYSLRIESPRQPEVSELVGELDDYQKPLYPPESHHGIDIPELCRANVIFSVLRDAGGKAVGCGAVLLDGETGELKRMFLRTPFQGRGLGQRILHFLEREARLRGCRVLRLETGIRQQAAIRLYEKNGYRRCGPFADYREDPWSLFMEKRLGGEPGITGGEIE